MSERNWLKFIMFVGLVLHHALSNSLKQVAYNKLITLEKSASVFSLSQYSSRCLSRLISSSVVLVGANNELTNFWVMLMPVTQKKYHVSGCVLFSNRGLAVDFE